MPRHIPPKKDAISCEKLRRGANIRRSADIRMRELSTEKPCYLYVKKIAYRGEPGELKHLSTRRRRKQK